MNTRFITLPSGLRVNAAHICGYRHIPNTEKTMVILDWEDGYGNKCCTEDMTIEQLDSILSPPQSPIVSPVIDLDRLSYGSGCSFTHEGKKRHGVIENIYCEETTPCIYVISDGERIGIDL